MIYFTIPSGSYNGRVVSQKQVNLDRNVGSSSEPVVHKNDAGRPISHVKANGINNINESITFSISALTDTDYLDIISYLRYLKSRSIDIVFPDETKKVVITSWSSNLSHPTFSTIGVKAELVYL